MIKRYSLIATLLISLGLLVLSFQQSSINNIKTDDLLRFHVVANSDLDKDQAVKLQVKNKILEKYYAICSAFETKDEAVDYFNNHSSEVKTVAEAVLAEEGFNYPVEVFIQEEYFPTKKYRELVTPAGKYTALKVVIGQGKGNNWWCVLFPPLCLVNITKNNQGTPVIDWDMTVPALSGSKKKLDEKRNSEKQINSKVNIIVNKYKTKLDKLMNAQ